MREKPQYGCEPFSDDYNLRFWNSQRNHFNWHAKDDVSKAELESMAASWLIDRLLKGGLGGTDPILLFQYALNNLKDLYREDLCKHLRAVIVRPEDGQTHGYLSAKWSYLHPNTRSAIWHVFVKGYLLDLAKRYGFTDLQDEYEAGVLSTRLSQIACEILDQLEDACLAGDIIKPFEIHERDSAVPDEDYPNLEFDFTNGKLIYGTEWTKATAIPLKILKSLYSRLGTTLGPNELRVAVWKPDSTIDELSIGRQVRAARKLLERITTDLVIETVHDEGWYMHRVYPGA